MKYTDRFNRLYLNDQYGSTTCSIAYKQDPCNSSSNRDKLPAYYWANGTIVWRNTDDRFHCTTGPSMISIMGDITYWLNGSRVTILEVRMA